MVENYVNQKIKCLRFDRGGYFTSIEFNEACEEHGIKRHLFNLRTPQRNEVVERKNWIVWEVARTMIKEENVLYVY